LLKILKAKVDELQRKVDEQNNYINKLQNYVQNGSETKQAFVNISEEGGQTLKVLLYFIFSKYSSSFL
jgi:hypothetical protein